MQADEQAANRRNDSPLWNTVDDGPIAAETVRALEGHLLIATPLFDADEETDVNRIVYRDPQPELGSVSSSSS